MEPSEQALLTYAKEGPVGEAMQLQCLHLFAELVQETVEELEATEKKGLGDLFQLKVIVRVQISDPPLRIVAGAPGQVSAAQDERLQQRPLGLLRRLSALQRGLHRPCAPPPPGLQAAGGLRRVGARFPELTPRRPHHLLIVRVQADGAESPQDKVRGAGLTWQPQRPAPAAVAGSLVVMATGKQGWRACGPGSLALSTCSPRARTCEWHNLPQDLGLGVHFGELIL